MPTSLKDDINPFSKAHFSWDPLGLFGGHKNSSPPVEPTLPTEADYASALAQRPVPYYAGRRRIPLSWVTDVFNVESINTPTAGGGKSGGGKKGGGSGQKTYYCAIAGVVALGPADYVLTMESDNDMVNPTWSGVLARSGDYADLTPTDINYGGGADLLSGGRIRLYWGTEIQTVDPILTGQPGYAGYTYVVLKRFLMGSSRGTPRDVNLTLARLPAVDTSIVAGASNTFSTDGTYQVNPIAVMAEIFTAPWGLGFPISMLDATSWLAESADVWTNRQIYAQCSCFFDSIELARNKLPDLMLMADVALRWLPNGKLGLARILPGFVPSNAASFDARQFRDTAPLKPKSQGLSGLATKVQVDYYNSDPGNYPISWKNDNVQASDLWALQIMDYVPRTLKVSRPFACGVAQAMLHGQEALRRQSVPSLTGVARLRSGEIAVDTGGNPIQPGDKHYFDIDPVPGGSTTMALATVAGRTDFADGTVDLDLRFDAMQAVALTLPAWGGGVVRPTPTAASILHALIVPQITSDNHAAAWIVATRPDVTIHGFKAFFGVSTSGDFVELGNQSGFGCRAALVSDITAFASTIRFSITDGDSGPDGYLAGQTPENTTAAQGDSLLAIICYVDGNGAINNSGGLPVMEILSLVSRSAVSTGVYDYVALRGRQNTAAAAWSHSTAVVWIVPKGNLTKWTTPVMDSESGTGDTNWCPLQSYTDGASDTTIPLPRFAVKFPELGGSIDGGGNYNNYFRVVTGGTTTVKCKERSGTASLVGCPEFASPSSPPKKYRRTEYSGSHSTSFFSDAGCTTPSGDPTVTCVPTYWSQYDQVTGALTQGGNNVCNGSPIGGSITCVSAPANLCHETYTTTPTTITSAPTTTCCATGSTPAYRKNAGGSFVVTLSDEDLEADAIARLVATFTDWGSLTWTACTMLPCCSSTRTLRTTGFDISYAEGMVQINVTGLVVVDAYVVMRAVIWRTDLTTMIDEPAETNDYEATVDGMGAGTWEFLLPNEAGYTYYLKSYEFLGFISL